MSTIAQIQKEAESLPNSLQQKVLVYIELLKYQAAVSQTIDFANQAGGIQTNEQETMEDIAALAGESSINNWSLEEIHKKTLLIEQINGALTRAKAGERGLSTEELRKQVQQWAKQ